MSSLQSHLAKTAANGHRINLDDVEPRMAKAVVNKVDDATKRARFGSILRRSVELSGLIEKEAAERLRVDRAQFSRWLSGIENAHVWKFFDDDVLGPSLLGAMAEETAGASIRTVIELRRKVG